MQSLAHSGKVLIPVIASKLYWSISFTSMFYGIEIWELSNVDFGKVESAHRQMARHLQSLPGFTAGTAVLATQGWFSLSAWVDRR